MELAYADRTELEVGRASNPVVVDDLRLGDGKVIPEINYALPPMTTESHNRAEVQGQFRGIADAVLDRAEQLHRPGLVLEFEHLPALTEHAEIGMAITEQTRRLTQDFRDRTGIPVALRVTVSDPRDMERPLRMRSGCNWDTLGSCEAEGQGDSCGERAVRGPVPGRGVRRAVSRPRGSPAGGDSS